ncbi:MAG: oligosaccharide flippase family protein [Elusimicrobia bacterium]|nr:oligosaccharide flippase family protein [Elusimicrobiota bacterium]
MSRLARFATGVRFNAYGQVLQAALPFFFIPFALDKLGKEAYGLYALIGVVTAQLNLLSFGAGPATVKFLAEFESAMDRAKVERLVGNSLVFYGLTGAAGAAILVCASPFIGRDLLHVSHALMPAVSFIILCAAGTFAAQSFARTFQSVPQALHRFDLWNGAECAIALLQYAGAFALLAAGFWLRALAAWTFAVTVLGLVAYSLLSRRLLPGISLRPSYDAEMMKKVVGFGGWLFLSQVAWSAFYQADKLVLGHYNASLAELPYYLVSFTLAQKLYLVLNPIMPTLLPFSSAMHGANDREGAKRFFLSGTKLTVLLMLPATILGMLFAPAFLDLWLGGGFGLHAGWPLRLLLAGTFASAVPAFGHAIAQGFGKVRLPSIVFTAAAALGLLLWPFVLPRWGALGAAAVFLLVQGVYSTWLLLWSARSVVGVSLADLARAVGAPLIAAVPLAIVSGWFRNSIHSWIGLAAFGSVSFTAYLAAGYWTVFDSHEREKVSRGLRAALSA